jgi:hypothetical protein
MMSTNDSEWNSQQEDYLKKLHFQSIENYKFWNIKNLKYQRISKYFNIPILVISAMNSLFAMILQDYIGQELTSITNARLSVLTAILGSVQLFLKINEKVSNSLIVSMKFHKLSIKISKELSIHRDDRATNGNTFLQDVFNEYNDILEKSGCVDKVLRDYLQLQNINCDNVSNSTLSSRDDVV